MTINVIGRTSLFLGISFVLIAVSVGTISKFGVKEGIDFRGGALWQFSLQDASPTLEELQTLFADTLDSADIRVSTDAETGYFIVKTPPVAEEQHAEVLREIREAYGELEEAGFQSIGPSVGEELRQRSVVAVILVLTAISLYIAFAFRKIFWPISSWKYGVVTLITLFHDVLIPTSLIAILGAYRGVEIDGNFVVALLVVAGFSVHDTIVVFDRIRENLVSRKGKEEFAGIVNTSVNQTMARSINTSLTLIIVLVALYVAGPESLRYFILTLLVGVTTGVYSSIFVASPLLYSWHAFGKRPTKGV